MFLSLPFNGDVSLADKLQHLELTTFYGQVANDTLGGGRVQVKNGLPQDLEAFITAIKRQKKQFNYIINGNCFSNLEFSSSVKKLLYNKLEWLQQLGVEMVTLSNPFFVKFCRKHFPDLKISLSVITHVDNLKQLLWWEDQGIDQITLSKDINRDFETLTQMHKNSKVKLQLIVNDPCIPFCHLSNYHNSISSSASQNGILPIKVEHVNYCTSECRKIMLSDPVNIIKAMWIRPEDLGAYEKVGVHSLKLVDRKESTEWIVRATKAYADKKYNGNLADLMSFFSLNKDDGCSEPDRLSAPLAKDDIKWLTIPKEHKIDFRFKPYIDNTKLDGFIDGFIRSNCRNLNCKKCGYCAKYAEAVSINDDDRTTVMTNLSTYINTLLDNE
jgi:collagenase-like PrtC family protease